MDITYAGNEYRGPTSLTRLLLLLFLTACRPVMCLKEELQEDLENRNQSLKVEIIGGNYVTVGVASSMECVSSCSRCTYSMSVDGLNAQGQSNRLTFTVQTWVRDLSVTCTVTDEEEGLFAMETKKLQVLAGPVNVSISGPDLMSPGIRHTYSCHAHCQPSCFYMWETDEGLWFRGQGNAISVTPQKENTKTISCKATNTVSGLFVTMTRNISLITGPSQVQIKGPDVVEIGQEYQFACSAECHPSCRYVSSVGSETVRGNVIEMTVDQPLKSFTLKCEAQNTVSGKTVTGFKTVHGAGVDRSRATCLEVTQVGLLVAFIISGFSTL